MSKLSPAVFPAADVMHGRGALKRLDLSLSYEVIEDMSKKK